MKKSLFFGMAALLMAGITSCSNDDILQDFDASKPLEADQSFYTHIDIRSTESMTRAGKLIENPTDENDMSKFDYTYEPDGEPDFNPGTEQENTVKTIYLIFYDKEGNRVSTTQVRKENGEKGDGRNPSENSLYQGIVQIDVKHGQLPPRYVMCFINPITSMNFDMNPDFATLDALQQTTRPRIIDDNGNFAMSKSVYYGANRAAEGYEESWKTDPSKYEKIIATPIPAGQLFKSVEEARRQMALWDDREKQELQLADGETRPTEDPVLDIYVERYAAKVNFLVDEGATNTTMTLVAAGEDGQGEIKLEFVPEYWAVNAYEEETYICKSFLDDALVGDMSYETLNNALGGTKAWYWNSPTFHRCYWAQTPGYYQSKYPRVADDILDNRTPNDKKGGYSLGYYSYDDMVKNAAPNSLIDKARKVEKGKVTTIYARENTTAGKSLQAANNDPLASPKAAIASAVLVGHYKVNGKEVPEGTTFYVMGNATNGYTYYENGDAMKEWFVNITIPFYTNDEGSETFYNYGIDGWGFKDGMDAYKSLFKIEHPSKPVRTLNAANPAVIDSRFVTIQLDDEKVTAAGAPELYVYLDGEYQKVTSANIDRVNQQMFYQAGTVQGFEGGKAFFTIPIKHLGFYRDDNANAGKMGTEKNFNWNEVLSGDFGLVRNHVYTIEVSKIQGLGNGIPNTSDPIVPPTDPEEYFIGARIIVLNWAVVPTQKVEL